MDLDIQLEPLTFSLKSFLAASFSPLAFTAELILGTILRPFGVGKVSTTAFLGFTLPIFPSFTGLASTSTSFSAFSTSYRNQIETYIQAEDM